MKFTKTYLFPIKKTCFHSASAFRFCRIAATAILIPALILFLSGCAGPGQRASAEDRPLAEIPPANTDGSIPVGGLVDVPAEIDGFELTEYNEALTASGYYYAAWATGTSSVYTNSDGKQAQLYPAQIYMIVYEGTDQADASSRAAAWLAAAEQQYTVREKTGGGDRTLLSYSIPDQANPYSDGASAFLSEDTCAICVEVLRTENWSGNPASALEHFLEQLSLREPG